MSTQAIKGEDVTLQKNKENRQLIVELAKTYKGREGFVSPAAGRQGFRLIGMFVPGMSDKSTLVMNRFLVPDKAAPTWFTELCNDLLEGKQSPEETNMKLRVRVVGVGGDAMAFAMPRATSREHALVEWKRHHSTSTVRKTTDSGAPRRWTADASTEQMCREIYSLALDNFNNEMSKTGNKFYIADWFGGPKSTPFSEVIIDSHQFGGLRRIRGATDMINAVDASWGDFDEMAPLMKQYIKIDLINQPETLIQLLSRE